MIVSLNLPSSIASALALESARTGQSPSAWLLDRLADHFALRPPAPSASRVKLLPTDNDDTANDDL